LTQVVLLRYAALAMTDPVLGPIGVAGGLIVALAGVHSAITTPAAADRFAKGAAPS